MRKGYRLQFFAMARLVFLIFLFFCFLLFLWFFIFSVFSFFLWQRWDHNPRSYYDDICIKIGETLGTVHFYCDKCAIIWYWYVRETVVGDC